MGKTKKFKKLKVSTAGLGQPQQKPDPLSLETIMREIVKYPVLHANWKLQQESSFFVTKRERREAQAAIRSKLRVRRFSANNALQMYTKLLRHLVSSALSSGRARGRGGGGGALTAEDVLSAAPAWVREVDSVLNMLPGTIQQAIWRGARAAPACAAEGGAEAAVPAPLLGAVRALGAALALGADAHAALAAAAAAAAAAVPRDQLVYLWSRIRSVCVKKLRLLASAGDVPAATAPAARLRPADWFALDLALLHYTDTGNLVDNESMKQYDELSTLTLLFSLVQHFRLTESGTRDDWITALHAYINRGRVSSIVVLQRRWYELVRLTRDTIAAARRSAPAAAAVPGAPADPALTPLLRQIAIRFPDLIAAPLPPWERLVREGSIYTTDLDEYLRMEQHRREQPARDEHIQLWSGDDTLVRSDEDDLVLVEDDVDTVNLASSSDSDVTATEEDAQPARKRRKISTRSADVKPDIEEHDINIQEHNVETPANANDTEKKAEGMDLQCVENLSENLNEMEAQESAVGGNGKGSVDKSSSRDKITEESLELLGLKLRFSRERVTADDSDDSGDLVVDHESDQPERIIFKTSVGLVHTLVIGSDSEEGEKEVQMSEKVVESSEKVLKSGEKEVASLIKGIDPVDTSALLTYLDPNKAEAKIIFSDDDDDDDMDFAQLNDEINTLVEQNINKERDSNADDVKLEPVETIRRSFASKIKFESQPLEAAVKTEPDDENLAEETDSLSNEATVSVEAKQKIYECENKLIGQMTKNSNSTNYTKDFEKAMVTNSNKEANTKENDDMTDDDMSIAELVKQVNDNIDADEEMSDHIEEKNTETNEGSCSKISDESYIKDIDFEISNKLKAYVNNKISNSLSLKESTDRGANKVYDNKNDRKAICIDFGIDSDDNDQSDNKCEIEDSVKQQDVMNRDSNVHTDEKSAVPITDVNHEYEDSAFGFKIDPETKYWLKIRNRSRSQVKCYSGRDLLGNPDFFANLRQLDEEFVTKHCRLFNVCSRATVDLDVLPFPGAPGKRSYSQMCAGSASETGSEEGGGASETARARKKVSLADIEEVRRHYRGMLTAQVRPLAHSQTKDSGSPAPPEQEQETETPSAPEEPPLTREDIDAVLRTLQCQTTVGQIRARMMAVPRVGELGPAPAPGRAGAARWCCSARRHLACNRARAKLAAKAGRAPPPDMHIHGCRTMDACKCCCKEVLQRSVSAHDVMSDVRELRQYVRRLWAGERSQGHSNAEQDNAEQFLDKPAIEQKNKKPRSKPTKRRSKKAAATERESEDEEQKDSEEDPEYRLQREMEEWRRLKSANAKYFQLRGTSSAGNGRPGKGSLQTIDDVTAHVANLRNNRFQRMNSNIPTISNAPTAPLTILNIAKHNGEGAITITDDSNHSTSSLVVDEASNVAVAPQIDNIRISVTVDPQDVDVVSDANVQNVDENTQVKDRNETENENEQGKEILAKPDGLNDPNVLYATGVVETQNVSEDNSVNKTPIIVPTTVTSEKWQPTIVVDGSIPRTIIIEGIQNIPPCAAGNSRSIMPGDSVLTNTYPGFSLTTVTKVAEIQPCPPPLVKILPKPPPISKTASNVSLDISTNSAPSSETVPIVTESKLPVTAGNDLIKPQNVAKDSSVALALVQPENEPTESGNVPIQPEHVEASSKNTMLPFKRGKDVKTFIVIDPYVIPEIKTKPANQADTKNIRKYVRSLLKPEYRQQLTIQTEELTQTATDDVTTPPVKSLNESFLKEELKESRGSSPLLSARCKAQSDSSDNDDTKPVHTKSPNIKIMKVTKSKKTVQGNDPNESHALTGPSQGQSEANKAIQPIGQQGEPADTQSNRDAVEPNKDFSSSITKTYPATTIKTKLVTSVYQAKLKVKNCDTPTTPTELTKRETDIVPQKQVQNDNLAEKPELSNVTSIERPQKSNKPREEPEQSQSKSNHSDSKLEVASKIDDMDKIISAVKRYAASVNQTPQQVIKMIKEAQKKKPKENVKEGDGCRSIASGKSVTAPAKNTMTEDPIEISDDESKPIPEPSMPDIKAETPLPASDGTSTPVVGTVTSMAGSKGMSLQISNVMSLPVSSVKAAPVTSSVKSMPVTSSIKSLPVSSVKSMPNTSFVKSAQVNSSVKSLPVIRIGPLTANKTAKSMPVINSQKSGAFMRNFVPLPGASAVPSLPVISAVTSLKKTTVLGDAKPSARPVQEKAAAPMKLSLTINLPETAAPVAVRPAQDKLPPAHSYVSVESLTCRDEPFVTAAEYLENRDPTRIEVLCVDMGKRESILTLYERYLVVTSLKLESEEPAYFTMEPRRAGRRLVFGYSEDGTGSSDVDGLLAAVTNVAARTAHAAQTATPVASVGRLKVRSFAALAHGASDGKPHELVADGKLFRKMTDQPMVYAQVWSVVADAGSCRAVLARGARLSVYDTERGAVCSDLLHAVQDYRVDLVSLLVDLMNESPPEVISVDSDGE